MGDAIYGAMKKLVFLAAVLLLLMGCTQKVVEEKNITEAPVKEVPTELKNYVYYGNENGSAMFDVLTESGKVLNYYLWVKNSGAEEKCKVLRHEGDFTFLDRNYEWLSPGQNKIRLISIVPPTYLIGNMTISDKEVICVAGNLTANYTPSFRMRFWSLYDKYGDWNPNLVVLKKNEESKYEKDGLLLNFKLLDIQYEKCQLALNNQTFWMNEKGTKDFGNFTLILGRAYSYSECDFVVMNK